MSVCVGGVRGAYLGDIGNTGTDGRLISKWTLRKSGMKCIEQGPAVCSYEHRTFGFHESTEFLDQMNKYQLLKEDVIQDTEVMAYFMYWNSICQQALKKSTEP
jgi:hypothetical protein